MFFRRHLSIRFGLATTLAGASVFALILLQLMGATEFDARGITDKGRPGTYMAVLRMIVVWNWGGHLCLSLSSLSEPARFHGGSLGQGSQYTP